MRKVAILGATMTKFGKLTQGLDELLLEPSLAAIESSKLSEKDLDLLYISNMLGGELTKQVSLGTMLADELGVKIGADRIENGPAAGASAIKDAFIAIKSGLFDLVLVAGAEKMTHMATEVISEYISYMLHPVERMSGATLPSLGAMLARLYMKQYSVTSEDLAMVAVKNHKNALNNPYAHLQKMVTVDNLLHSNEMEKINPMVADPLRRFDISPISDGGAAVVLAELEIAKKYTDLPVTIEGFGQATDSLALHERSAPTDINAVKEASKQAFKMSGISPDQIDVAELHDAFTILELVESEDAGFFEKGTAHKMVREGQTEIGGKLPINTSGGLKARGHPLGATGLSQVVELVWQLRGEARGRQVPSATYGFSVNLGGFGSNAVSLILKRGD
ncbi:MAG: thiolase domain-containing protein [Nitrososphaerota archaeon]|jgi:acetyl-CoA C-acetyltransferase|nr:thiolase domain-containing protein [Nitrososphaerota archaeon]MDG7046492.1 thiolase domain-containing protein [Nitrososphaerota archaeon]